VGLVSTCINERLTVQWQAWLRHTRTGAPTIQELVQEERRKALVQERAKALDQEWEQVCVLYSVGWYRS